MHRDAVRWQTGCECECARSLSACCIVTLTWILIITVTGEALRSECLL